MKRDFTHKQEKLARLVPGFVGYTPVHLLKTDYLLRRFLAGKMEEVRDRLAEFVAARREEMEVPEELTLSLRTAAFLKEEVTPRQEEVGEERPFSPLDEERLLDFDLALLDKVAGLRALVDAMEAAGTEAALRLALEAFDEGLAEVDDLFRLRRQVLKGGE